MYMRVMARPRPLQAGIPVELERAFDAALLIDKNTRAALFEKETERAFSPIGGAST